MLNHHKSALLIAVTIIFSLSSISVTQGYALSGGYTNINSQTFDYSSFENTVLLIDATASWCTACDVQLKNLNKVHDLVDSRVSILTLSIDVNDKLDQVAELKTRYSSGWVFGKDSNLDFKDQYEVINLPTLFLFEEDGSIFKKWEGITSPKVILDAINEHLDDPFDAAFDTDRSAEVGSLIDDLFSNSLFQIVSLILIVVLFYLRVSPSSNRKTIDTKS